MGRILEYVTGNTDTRAVAVTMGGVTASLVGRLGLSGYVNWEKIK